MANETPQSWSTQFEPLDKKTHDRQTFNCGESELNAFIKTKAAKHMQAGISRTMVLPTAIAFDNNTYAICAFYSIAASTICRDVLPVPMAKKLPHYPVPVFLIAQLAVHQDFHGKGLGKISLVQALAHLWQVNQHMPAYAVIVDCLNDAAKGFYQQFGFEFLYEHHGRARLFLPMNTVKMLFT